MGSHAPRFFTLFAFALVGCGSSSSSAPSSAPDTLAPDATFVSSFYASGGRSSEDPVIVSGSLFLRDDEARLRTEDIPEGRLFVVTNGTRTPLARKVERSDGFDDFVYRAELPAVPPGTPLSIVLARETDHVVATTTLPAPLTFTIVDTPPTLGAGDKLTVELSRPVPPEEELELVLKGCFKTVLARTTSVGVRAVFSLDKLDPLEACDATIELQVNRRGAIDAAFAQATTTGTAARFDGKRISLSTLKRPVTERKR